MISFLKYYRFRKAAEKSGSTEKLPPTSDALAIEGSPTAEPNFLCGLPNYTEAQRNLAYYYEDEDECDTKTMFVGDGFDGMRQFPIVNCNYKHFALVDAGDKNVSHSNSKDELYNRLKRVQNHMYKPKEGEADGYRQSMNFFDSFFVRWRRK